MTASKTTKKKRNAVDLAVVPTSKLRRIALARQGLAQPNAFGRGKRGTQKAIEQLGYVQIDTISVVERAHHHVLHSRVSNYEARLMDRLIHERTAFEYWAHAAAYLPMSDFRFMLGDMQMYREGRTRWVRSRDKKLMAQVLARVKTDGPLMARDFETPEHLKKKAEGWWDWKPAKRALEQLFMQGDLMVTERSGFQKTYDLTERVLPSGQDVRHPTLEEFGEYLVDGTLRAHGFSTLKGFTYGRRGADIRKSVKTNIEARIDSGELVAFKLDSGDTAYGHAELIEQAKPRVSSQVLLLSPFDNTVIQRDRGIQLFDFDYQIECYVTESKRQFGYFCLPILYRDALVGRADCKAHRKDQRFEIKALFLERDTDEYFLPELANALWRFAVFNKCNVVDVTATQPRKLKKPLTHALEHT